MHAGAHTAEEIALPGDRQFMLEENKYYRKALPVTPKEYLGPEPQLTCLGKSITSVELC